MIKFFSQLIWGKEAVDTPSLESALVRRWKNLLVIWNNELHHDIGVERLVRLLLALSQFIFLGTYLRQIFGRKSSLSRDLSIDVLVIAKIVFAVCIVRYQWYLNNYVFYILCWLMVETFLYIPTLIFASDYISRPRSYRRAIMLFFLNYIEIGIDYGAIYAKYATMNKPFNHWFDSIYFSFISASSTGFGDYYPEDYLSKMLVVSHTLLSIVFIVLFLNSFSSKMEITGYFNSNDKH
jgi:voltage-gated potassium channel